MKRLLLGVAFAASCSSAFAASPYQSLYVSAEVGSANYDVSNSDATLVVSSGSSTTVYYGNVDNRDTAKLFTLGIRPSESFALDAGYADLGSVGVQYPGLGDGSVDVTGFTLGGTLMLPAYRQFSLFARAGLFHWKEEATAHTAYGSGSNSDSGNDPYVGVGFLFGWDNLKFRAGYTRFEVDGDHVNVASAGLQYFFPAR